MNKKDSLKIFDEITEILERNGCSNEECITFLLALAEVIRESSHKQPFSKELLIDSLEFFKDNI